MKILKLFPIIPLIFSEDGITSSECQRLAELNRNGAKKMLQKLDGDLYVKVREILSPNGVTRSEAELKRILPDNFSVVVQIAELYKMSAIYRFAIKYKDGLRKDIEFLNCDRIGEVFGIKKPENPNIAHPIKQTVSNLKIDQFCDQKQIEDMFINSNAELLDICKEFFMDAMQIEAMAAVYGKQVASDDSFLRKLNAAPESLKSSEIKTDGMIVFVTENLAYKKEDFEIIEEVLMGTYTDYQKKRNSYMKQIKDAARTLQHKYDKEFTLNVQKYNSEMQKYNGDVMQWTSTCETIRTELLQEVAQLKIRVPRD